MFNRRTKYYARLMIMVNGRYQTIRTKKFVPTSKAIDFRGDTYIIDYATPIYQTPRGKVFFHFAKDGGQIRLVESEPQVNKQLINALFKQELPRQLVAGLKDAMSNIVDKVIFAVMGAAGGVGLGWVICSMMG